jgi:hypothetical protein
MIAPYQLDFFLLGVQVDTLQSFKLIAPPFLKPAGRDIVGLLTPAFLACAGLPYALPSGPYVITPKDASPIGLDGAGAGVGPRKGGPGIFSKFDGGIGFGIGIGIGFGIGFGGSRGGALPLRGGGGGGTNFLEGAGPDAMIYSLPAGTIPPLHRSP